MCGAPSRPSSPRRTASWIRCAWTACLTRTRPGVSPARAEGFAIAFREAALVAADPLVDVDSRRLSIEVNERPT